MRLIWKKYDSDFDPIVTTVGVVFVVAGVYGAVISSEDAGVKHKYRKVEQMCRNDGGGAAGRKFCKKLTARAMRRAAKVDPEGEPKKPKYGGYSV